jgi:hypothetical protein
MGQLPKKNYLNGIFVKKKSGQFGEFFSVGIKKADLISQLNSMKEDERGFVNLVMTSQQADPSKYSVYEDTWKPTNTAQPAANTTSNHRTATEAMMADSSDVLPF